MRIHLKLAGLIAVAALTSALPASSGHAQSLQDALAAAYAGNPTLQAKRAALRAIDEGVPQALAGWRPSLSASIASGVKDNYLNTRTSNKNQQPSPHSTSLTLSQPLYSGGQTVAAIASAENDVLAGRAELVGIEQTVLLNALKAYVNVFRAESILGLRVSNEQVLKRQLEATSDRFEVGEITRTDVHQAEARLARTTADRIQAEGDLVSNRAAFRNIVGFAPEKLSRPVMDLNLPTSPGDSVKLAVSQNPAVISAEFSERAAREDINGVRGELLPSLDLAGSASRSLNASSQSTRTDSYSASLTLSVPLYQSGAVYSRLRAARQTASQRRREIDVARRDAIETATRTWETLQTTRARIVSLNAQIRASEIALEGVQREASVGSRTVLDVLDAEQELLDAKVNSVSAQRDESIASFELKSAIGELTARDLNLSVDAYDSTDHYNDVRQKWFGGDVKKDVTQ